MFDETFLSEERSEVYVANRFSRVFANAVVRILQKSAPVMTGADGKFQSRSLIPAGQAAGG